MNGMTLTKSALLALVAALFALPVQATIIGVAGGSSAVFPGPVAGAAPAIIGAPTDVLDDLVTNRGMQGFDEAQGVVTTAAYTNDLGVLAQGSLVDSHMIFLNSGGTTRIEHFGVTWDFDGIIVAIMSDSMGNDEAASTGDLGAPGTNYTVGAVGQVAPFAARGLETANGGAGGGGNNDGYTILPGGMSLQVAMEVTEPGDWIRVVTRRVPEPASLLLLGLGLLGIGFGRARKLRG